MAFWVGQKVVCVRQMKADDACEIMPIVGTVYTVRELGEIYDIQFIRLVEIVNQQFKYREGIVEAAFEASSFRPIVDRKTDISIFTEMLNKEPATC